MSEDKEIVVDMNRLTRSEFRDFRNGLKAINDDDIDAREKYMSQFYPKVIVEWPFGEVTPEKYLSLGMLDAMKVDGKVNEAIRAISEKK